MSEQLDRTLAVRREDYVVGADVRIDGSEWVIVEIDWDRVRPLTCRPRGGTVTCTWRACHVEVVPTTWTVEQIEAFLA